MQRRQTKKKTEKKMGKEIKIWRMGMEQKMKIIGWRMEMGVRPPPLHKNYNVDKILNEVFLDCFFWCE